MCVMSRVCLLGWGFTSLLAFKDKAMIKGKRLLICCALGGRALVGVMCRGSFNSASCQRLAPVPRPHSPTVNIQWKSHYYGCLFGLLYSRGVGLFGNDQHWVFCFFLMFEYFSAALFTVLKLSQL